MGLRSPLDRKTGARRRSHQNPRHDTKADSMAFGHLHEAPLMAKYLVTGGAGFIGSHLVSALHARGDSVVILDDFSTGSRANASSLPPSVVLMEGSITDPSVCGRATEGVDYVLHQAALPSVPRSIEDPIATNLVNVTGTLNMLIAARDAGVVRFVFASSSSVYGETRELPKTEAMPCTPCTPYAITKLAAEQYCQAFHGLYGLETICLRYFNVFGPRQDPDSPYAAAIPIFLRLLHAGKPPVFFGDGSQSRDFTYVANIVRANLAACSAPREATGGVYNCACGNRVSVREAAEALQRLLGTSITPVTMPERPGDIRHSHADITKARAVLGYEPETSFEEGLAETVEWYKSA